MGSNNLKEYYQKILQSKEIIIRETISKDGLFSFYISNKGYPVSYIEIKNLYERFLFENEERLIVCSDSYFNYLKLKEDNMISISNGKHINDLDTFVVDGKVMPILGFSIRYIVKLFLKLFDISNIEFQLATEYSNQIIEILKENNVFDVSSNLGVLSDFIKVNNISKLVIAASLKKLIINTIKNIYTNKDLLVCYEQDISEIEFLKEALQPNLKSFYKTEISDLIIDGEPPIKLNNENVIIVKELTDIEKINNDINNIIIDIENTFEASAIKTFLLKKKCNITYCPTTNIDDYERYFSSRNKKLESILNTSFFYLNKVDFDNFIDHIESEMKSEILYPRVDVNALSKKELIEVGNTLNITRFSKENMIAISTAIYREIMKGDLSCSLVNAFFNTNNLLLNNENAFVLQLEVINKLIQSNCTKNHNENVNKVLVTFKKIICETYIAYKDLLFKSSLAGSETILDEYKNTIGLYPEYKINIQDFQSMLNSFGIKKQYFLSSFGTRLPSSNIDNLKQSKLEMNLDNISERIRSYKFEFNNTDIVILSNFLYYLVRSMIYKNYWSTDNYFIERIIYILERIIEYTTDNTNIFHPNVYYRILTLMSLKNNLKIRYNIDNKKWNIEDLILCYYKDIKFILDNNYHAINSGTVSKAIDEISKIRNYVNKFNIKSIDDKEIESIYVREVRKMSLISLNELNISGTIKNTKYFEDDFHIKTLSFNKKDIKDRVFVYRYRLQDYLEISRAYNCAFLFVSRYTNIYLKKHASNKAENISNYWNIFLRNFKNNNMAKVNNKSITTNDVNGDYIYEEF